MRTLKQYLMIQLGTTAAFLLAGGLSLSSGDWWAGGFLTAAGLIFGYSYYIALKEGRR